MKNKIGQYGAFRLGFVMALGVLGALAVGMATASLSGPLTLIFAALFISLGLDPLVRWLQRQGLSRGGSVAVVALGFVLVVAALVWAIVPLVTHQAMELIRTAPRHFSDVENQAWYLSVNGATGGAAKGVLDWAYEALEDPNFWLGVGGGVFQVGSAVAGGTVGALFVVILTIYMVSSLDSISRALYSLVPASKRGSFVPIAEEIAKSIGTYLSGMVILAFLNSVFSFILLSILGVRYAFLLAVIAFVVSLVPLIGSVVSTAVITTVSLFTSPGTALIALICLVIYMQIEAYVLTPKIVGKTLNIPGSLVIIGAMLGGTLLGLLGALVAVPIVASIVLVVRKVVVPKQNAA
ncbi:AI-2E family transporter [Mycetocola spongiae]|uniref:AI-2E family transporter n=1 Tax=Mycetocola spongiae TaxID=2859226 RepID=UPI001CF244F1|nr:AI-2E family transporter [Mycetocola spongiae]UCR88850.1 AI-2E family transporter [Mycetocola spongiae]